MFETINEREIREIISSIQREIKKFENVKGKEDYVITLRENVVDMKEDLHHLSALQLIHQKT